jgi:hypothetical protein
VVVVHDESLAAAFDRWLAADRADSVLLDDEGVIFVEREAVQSHEVRAAVVACPKLRVQ